MSVSEVQLLGALAQKETRLCPISLANLGTQLVLSERAAEVVHSGLLWMKPVSLSNYGGRSGPLEQLLLLG